MIRCEIVVIDKDYGSLIDKYYKEFESEEQAVEYVEKNSWSGEYYYFNKIKVSE